MTIPAAVEASIHRLRLAGSRMVVAVSGGADSVALLRALLDHRRRYQLDLVVAHFNHHWRGADSDADAAFVCSLAETCGVRHYEGEAPPPPSLESVSEESARGDRYAFLEAVARQEHAVAIATAHHRDDQLETILFHVVRGTSWRGLAGIPAERVISEHLRVVRPLLTVPRSEIVAWLTQIGQPWRTDFSNLALDFTRNRLRAVVMPELAAINPRFDESLLRLAGQARELQDDLRLRAAAVLDALPESVSTETGETRLVFPRNPFRAASALLRREVLILIWRRQGWPLGAMDASHWERLSQLIDTTGSIHLPGALQAEVTSAEFLLTRPADRDILSSGG